MKIIYNIKKSGFTLIELLVVISIIGLLATFAMVSLNLARIKARDAVRKGEMAQLRTALALYFDQNNVYPVCNGLDNNDDPIEGIGLVAGSDCYHLYLSPALTTGVRPYMDHVPIDPLNKDNNTTDSGGNSTYIYRYHSDGTKYIIIYNLEEVDENYPNPQVIKSPSQ
jgi:prepilin-type N-terminal cleavage/methylation domain-containing protein